MNPNDRYDSLIRYYAEQNKLNWQRIKRQIAAESSFNPLASSPAGALGLMQFMPDTWAEWQTRHGALRIDPEVSIATGCRYMTFLYSCFGEILDETQRYCFALGAYNAGRGSIDRCLGWARASCGQLPSYDDWNEAGRKPGVWQTWDHASRSLSLVTGEHARETIAYVAKIMAPEIATANP